MDESRDRMASFPLLDGGLRECGPKYRNPGFIKTTGILYIPSPAINIDTKYLTKKIKLLV